MPSYQDLTLGFSNQVPRRLTRFARTGVLITIGCVPPVCLIARVIQRLELCQARGTLIVPCGSHLSFGIPVLKMESTGAALSSTGCTFPSSRDCSSKEKRTTLSLVPDRYASTL